MRRVLAALMAISIASITPARADILDGLAAAGDSLTDEYQFTSWRELLHERRWWRRTLVGEYLPPIGLSASDRKMPPPSGVSTDRRGRPRLAWGPTRREVR